MVSRKVSRRRFVAGCQQRVARGQKLVARQPVALVFGVDQRTDQVASWLPASSVAQLTYVREHLFEGCLRDAGGLQSRLPGSLKCENLGRPALEKVPVLSRSP